MRQGSETYYTFITKLLFRQEPVTYCRPEPLCVVTDIPKRGYSSQSTRPTGRALWEELLILFRFHS